VACSGNDASCPLVTEEATEATRTNCIAHCPIRLLSYSQETIYKDIAHTYHYCRGWTFQERLLSKRWIYFLGNKIIFHCREDIFHHIEDPCHWEEFNVFGDGWEEHIAKLSSARLQSSMQVWPINMSPTSWAKGFCFWTDMVQEYSQKIFTYDSDVLNACLGILYAFQGYSTSPVVQGIPEPLIEFALMWTPVTQVVRRNWKYEKGSKERFSTWSWLA
jgi:hypothetical protein